MNPTFNDWIATVPHVGYQRLDAWRIQVFSRDLQLWHLADYRVEATLSGPSVLLARRVDLSVLGPKTRKLVADRFGLSEGGAE